MRYRVLIPDRLPPPADIESEVFGPGSEVILCQAESADQVSDEVWKACDAVLAWDLCDYDRQLLASMKNCKIIVRVGAGFDNVDVQAASELGITVCNVPDYGTNDVADHTMALMLSLMRGVPALARSALDGAWNWSGARALRRITGSHLGVIGLGRIGTAVALRAKGFGLHVGFYDPYVPRGIEKSLSLIRHDSLDELAATSDIVTIHAPLTEETKGMINHTFLDSCSKEIILVNTARGPIVHANALYDALKQGRVRAAGLDVLSSEPPDRSHPLIAAWSAREPWIVDRLVITPHVAFYNTESYREMRYKAATEALRVLRGDTPHNQVVDRFRKQSTMERQEIL
jgi:lactate dehydrogenase-like 2-hydroxyacid dehydrogenase